MKLEDIKKHPTSGIATSMYMSEVVDCIKNGQLVLGDNDLQKLLETASYHVYRCGWSTDAFYGTLICECYNKALKEAVNFLSGIGLPEEKVSDFCDAQDTKFREAKNKEVKRSHL